VPERWTVLLPFKGPSGTKTRLGLEAGQRQALSASWLQHVIRCCRECPAVGEIGVISLCALDPVPGVRPFVQSQPGLNEGLEEVRARWGLEKLLVILPDLPFLRSEEINGLLQLCARPGISLAADRHQSGTNGLALWNAPEFHFCFGSDSLRRHQEQAHNLGLLAPCWRSPGFGHDVDTDADLEGLSWRTA
jgi:2-phospho-L-lactate/phosphoenolpyruvate guanylyltransferase